MIDYASKSSKQNLLDLLRIQISADEMVPDNILAELKKCKSIQWKITNEGIRLHYLIGNEAELNPCILKNMYPSKRNFLGSIANALPSIFEIGLAKKPEQLDAIMVLLNDARQREKYILKLYITFVLFVVSNLLQLRSVPPQALPYNPYQLR